MAYTNSVKTNDWWRGNGTAYQTPILATIPSSTTSMTVFAWVYVNAAEGRSFINRIYSAGGTEDWALYAYNYTPIFRVYQSDGTGKVLYGNAISNQWAFLCGVADGFNLTLYQDGVSVGGTASYNGTIASHNQAVHIGDLDPAGNYPLNGGVDYVGYCRYPLSPVNITNLYRNTHPTNNIIITRVASTAEVDIAYYFNGSDTYCMGTAPNTITNRIYGQQAITMAAWVFFNKATGGNQCIADTRNGSSGWDFGCLSGCRPWWQNRVTGNGISGPALSTGIWHYVVFSHTNGAQKLYADGVQVASSTEATTFTYSGFLCLGQAYNSGVYFLDGRIANIVVWDRILASNEVYDCYSKGAGIQPNVNVYPYNTNALCIWNFNENTGTQLMDSVSNYTQYIQKVTAPAGWTNAIQPYIW